MLIKDRPGTGCTFFDADDVNLKRRYSKYNFQFQFLLGATLLSPHTHRLRNESRRDTEKLTFESKNESISANEMKLNRMEA